MDQHWTELQVSVPAQEVDTAAAIAKMVVPYGIYIEDYSDLVTEAPRIAHIDLIDEDLLAKATRIEEVVREHFAAHADERIGEVRGRGAMMAIELVEPGTGEPDAALTAAVAAAVRATGVILLTCGTYGNVVRFLPPLTISEELLREGLQEVTDALQAL